MRRIGGLAVTMALIVLGLGAGLWLGTPASAATPPIQVDMHDGSGYVTSTSTSLLDVSALAPGGSASGTMDVKDDSGNAAGSGSTDTITLTMVDVTTADGKVAGAGDALRDALRFTVSVTGAGTIPSHGVLTLADLVSGVTLASGLVNGDVLHVSATASLPAGVGNEVQYGKVGFNLALDLTSTSADGGGSGTDGSPGGVANGSIGNAVGAAGGQGTPGTPEVAGEHQELPARNSDSSTGGNVLVLGENKSELPNTGVPVVSMLVVGGGVLIAGLAPLYAARRRTAGPLK
jgi:LPXTG-motif cell wall-anchored protein